MSEGRTEYFVRFGVVCQFIPKNECTVVYGLKRETNAALFV